MKTQALRLYYLDVEIFYLNIITYGVILTNAKITNIKQ